MRSRRGLPLRRKPTGSDRKRLLLEEQRLLLLLLLLLLKMGLSVWLLLQHMWLCRWHCEWLRGSSCRSRGSSARQRERAGMLHCIAAARPGMRSALQRRWR